jgi:hypothetical protein
MNDKIKQIIESFRKSVTTLESLLSSDSRVRQSAIFCQEAIAGLRSVVTSNELNTAGQIELYKVVLPEIFAARFFAVARYQIECHMPSGPRNLQAAWIERQLLQINQHRELNGFYYQYFKTGSPQLDSFYFTSEAIGKADIFLAEEPVAPDFVPHMSTMFARLRSNDALEKLLIGWAGETAVPAKSNESRGNQPRWTGDVINLVELIYGLHLTGQLNHGNISLNELVRWAETNFQVNIGIVQRKFAEIQRRKRISVTKFIDQLRDSVIQKIDEAAL